MFIHWRKSAFCSTEYSRADKSLLNSILQAWPGAKIRVPETLNLFNYFSINRFPLVENMNQVKEIERRTQTCLIIPLLDQWNQSFRILSNLSCDDTSIYQTIKNNFELNYNVKKIWFLSGRTLTKKWSKIKFLFYVYKVLSHFETMLLSKNTYF